MATRASLAACLLIAAAAGPLAGPTARAAEIGFVEDFALAGDRTTALKQLIPGTEDHYYYYCLHYQNTQQFDKVDELLTQWIKRYNVGSPGTELEFAL